MADTQDLLNRGAILRAGTARQSGPERTFIVSGVGRGGTSLAASMLFHAGVYMGHHLGEAVYEDLEFAEAFHSRNRELLTRLIAHRNASHKRWGFKVPNLHDVIAYHDLSLFRAPHLIVMFRDPVAIAERAALAEHLHPLATMRDSLDSLKNLVGFLHLTAAPALLLSYEKALMNPSEFIDALARFCGIAVDDAMRETLLKAVEPNSPAYIAAARRQFVGRVEHVIDGVLFGWCWEVGSIAPVELDCYVGNDRITTFKAADFRPDLLEARLANGNHGFSLDLRPFHLNHDRRLTVRVTGREFVVPGSGQPLREYVRTP
ncbi:MAG: hypothetical protein U1E70_06605 [Acetobacteraceae bacterium]